MNRPAPGSGPGGIPDPVVREVIRTLSDASGGAARIESARGVGGGCIHQALALETSAGPFFLKWNRGDAGDAFTTEARALKTLRLATESHDLVKIPQVVGARDSDLDSPGWLLLEYLPPGRPGPGYSRSLGRGLACLHAAGGAALATAFPPGPGVAVPAPDSFGWPEENRIGSLPQSNPRTGSWPEFWREARLRPQLEALSNLGALEPGRDAWTERILEAVVPALEVAAPQGPHLLHGDLWSGNVHPGPSGEPVLVDPAAYLGHGEVDLAMAHLFGGFDGETFHAYAEVVDVPPGFDEVRRPLYQLYYLLVHVRLFGSGYLSRTRRAAEQVLANVR